VRQTSRILRSRKIKKQRKKVKGIHDNLYLILIKRAQIFIVLNKFILAPELVWIKEMKQSPTKQGGRGEGNCQTNKKTKANKIPDNTHNRNQFGGHIIRNNQSRESPKNY